MTLVSQIQNNYPPIFVIVDMSDCYTWSFPEFVPFCPSLYYFSTFKDFHQPSGQ